MQILWTKHPVDVGEHPAFVSHGISVNKAKVRVPFTLSSIVRSFAIFDGFVKAFAGFDHTGIVRTVVVVIAVRRMARWAFIRALHVGEFPTLEPDNRPERVGDIG